MVVPTHDIVLPDGYQENLDELLSSLHYIDTTELKIRVLGDDVNKNEDYNLIEGNYKTDEFVSYVLNGLNESMKTYNVSRGINASDASHFILSVWSMKIHDADSLNLLPDENYWVGLDKNFDLSNEMVENLWYFKYNTDSRLWEEVTIGPAEPIKGYMNITGNISRSVKDEASLLGDAEIEVWLTAFADQSVMLNINRDNTVCIEQDKYLQWTSSNKHSS